jgi:prepilin-type N-terminal cleavage/methylation domain-containing protein
MTRAHRAPEQFAGAEAGTGARRLRGPRAFTLIEMIITLAVISVLALIAGVGYRKWVISAHMGEAQDMVSNIRTAEESFKAENGAYLNVSAGLDPPNMYPQASPVGTVTTAWGGTCGSCTGSWTSLNVAPSAPVVFGYAVVAGAAGSTVPSIPWNGPSADLSAMASQPWYIVEAYCDLDGKGTPDTSVYGLSATNQLGINNEGQ